MNTAREEVNRLLSEAYQAAGFMLARGPRFEPFSLAMNSEGGIRIINAVLDPTQPSTIDERVAYARHVLRKLAEEGKVKATAFIAMAQIRLEGKEGYTDALVLEIEHRDDTAVNFYVPYEWQAEKPVLGKPLVSRRDPVIFVPERSGSSESALDELALRRKAEAFLRKPLPEGEEFDLLHGAVQNFLSESGEYSRSAVRVHRAAASVLRQPAEGATPAAVAYRGEFAELHEAIAEYLESRRVPN